MSGNSQSDDGSDILWPGYVDAVTNLAINLLFVIAVMSIVVLGATMKIAELSKRKATEGDTPTNNTPVGIEAKTLANLQESLANTTLQLQAAEERLKEAQKRLKQNAAGVQALDSQALVVKFTADAITMGNAETEELISKMKNLGDIKTMKWNLTVISPKGFSESSRTSFYRAHAVRNALLESGVPAASIDLRILESTQTGADNSRVLVRPLP
jgi:outer membrane protein OmpA-like peptidoglycan-associated protein